MIPLSRTEQCAEITEALVNWCYNTKTHLDEARRLKALKKRLPDDSIKIRKWAIQTNFLITKMWKELHKAEPDLMEGESESYHNHIVAPSKFLDMIPDEA